jgi:hypothetical protein
VLTAEKIMLRLALLAYFATAHAYHWPSPILDELESLLYIVTPGVSGMANFVQPCDTFSFAPKDSSGHTGRSNAADWIRTVRHIPSFWQLRIPYIAQAYHDMATHNIADGTGGLDASIRFAEEQARAEVCCVLCAMELRLTRPPRRTLVTGLLILLACSLGFRLATFPVKYLARGYPAEPDYFSTSQLLTSSRLEQSWPLNFGEFFLSLGPHLSTQCDSKWRS